jgi:hypothetical protein
MKEFSLRIAMLFVVFSLAIIFSTPHHVIALDTDKTSDENIIGEVSGVVNINRLGKMFIAKPGEQVYVKDGISTSIISKALLKFTDGSDFVVLDETMIEINSFMEDDGEKRGETKILINHGALQAMLGKHDITVYTPLSVAESIGKSKTLNIVTYKSIDGPPDKFVKVFPGTYSCRSKDEEPTVPVTIPQYIIDKYGPVEVLDFLVWEDTLEGKRRFCVAVFEFEECEECERINPVGKCVPDNHKPCDDGNPCTIDDQCLGGKCRGKRDPSPIDPQCEL